jgi:hypothetical protein
MTDAYFLTSATDHDQDTTAPKNRPKWLRWRTAMTPHNAFATRKKGRRNEGRKISPTNSQSRSYCLRGEQSTVQYSAWIAWIYSIYNRESNIVWNGTRGVSTNFILKSISYRIEPLYIFVLVPLSVVL